MSAETESAALGPSGGRVPPNELDAEAAVLSAVLLDPDAFDRVQETLAPEHFYADANRRI
jgi:replicative DNA helicase